MLQYYQIKSPLSRQADEDAVAFIGAVSEALDEEMQSVTAEEYAAADFALLFVASGGSEYHFKQIWNRVSNSLCCILTSGKNNSLAAAMEILSFIHQQGGQGEILHGDAKQIAGRIRSLEKIAKSLKRLTGKRVGMIGDPSDWLIASRGDESMMKKRLGITCVHLPVSRLADEYEKKQYIPNSLTEELLERSFDFGETRKALYVYGGLKRIVEKERLAGVTVRCFDLLDKLKTTTCLGLALLNSEGIDGGCEGDMPSLLSLMIAHAVTGEGAFMCNPSRIDCEKKVGVFAHCTLPVTMPDHWDTDTHFESGIGVAIRGTFDPQELTLFKCSGDLETWHVQKVHSIPMEFDPCLCRTQITLELDDAEYFLRKPIGNHHILMKGDHVQAINDLMTMISSAPVTPTLSLHL